MNLPMDLSPYGAIRKIEYEKDYIWDDDFYILIPRISTYYTDRNPVDEKTNAGIRALYERAKAEGFFGPDMYANWPELYVDNGKLIVTYMTSEYTGDEWKTIQISGVFDLSTGKEIKASG